MRRSVLLSFPALLLLALFAAACGGGSDDSGPTAAPSAVASSGTAASSTAAPNHGDEAAYQQLKTAATTFAALGAFHVVYDVRVQNTGGASFSASVALTHKDDTTRTDFDGTVNGTETHLVAIEAPNSLTVCQDQQGKTCAQTSDTSQGNPLASFDPVGILQTVLADPAMTIAPADSQAFAGISADCYTVKQSSQDSTFCTDPKSGALLLALGKSTQSGNQFTESIAANTFSTDVAAVDTSTPYPLATATGG